MFIPISASNPQAVTRSTPGMVHSRVTYPQKNYLSALYRRIAARRRAKRAVMAVAHALLEIAYHMLKRKEDYRELGADHFHGST